MGKTDDRMSAEERKGRMAYIVFQIVFWICMAFVVAAFCVKGTRPAKPAKPQETQTTQLCPKCQAELERELEKKPSKSVIKMQKLTIDYK